MDAAGNAVVIYENATNPNYKAIDAARYIVNTGWFYETLSNHELPGEINERSLAVSENGEAVAVWRLQNTLTYHLYYSVLPNISQGSWIPPKTISLPTAGYGALDATAAINASGYAIILWDRSQSKNGVYAIHKLPGTTDFIMQSQTVESATNAITPRVNIDAEGNALVSWYDINLKGVYTSQKIKMGDSWSPPKLVSEANQANIKYPQNAVGPLGHAQVVWSNQLLNGTTQNVIQGLDSALLINQ
jgi:hypothetical protein